jgi:hypothetical protein
MVEKASNPRAKASYSWASKSRAEQYWGCRGPYGPRSLVLSLEVDGEFKHVFHENPFCCVHAVEGENGLVEARPFRDARSAGTSEFSQIRFNFQDSSHVGQFGVSRVRDGDSQEVAAENLVLLQTPLGRCEERKVGSNGRVQNPVQIPGERELILIYRDTILRKGVEDVVVAHRRNNAFAPQSTGAQKERALIDTRLSWAFKVFSFVWQQPAHVDLECRHPSTRQAWEFAQFIGHPSRPVAGDEPRMHRKFAIAE